VTVNRHRPTPPSIVAGNGLSAEAAAAFNDLLRALAETHAQAQAALTAIERAAGARAASDSAWETRQSFPIWLVVLVAVLLAGGAAVIVVYLRRRRGDTSGDTPANEPGAPAEA
jgi:hypothetical protein